MPFETQLLESIFSSTVWKFETDGRTEGRTMSKGEMKEKIVMTTKRGENVAGLSSRKVRFITMPHTRMRASRRRFVCESTNVSRVRSLLIFWSARTRRSVLEFMRNRCDIKRPSKRRLQIITTSSHVLNRRRVISVSNEDTTAIWIPRTSLNI